MGLRWVRRHERVVDPNDLELSFLQAVLRSIGYSTTFEVAHAHTGVNADCECNIIRGED